MYARNRWALTDRRKHRIGMIDTGAKARVRFPGMKLTPVMKRDYEAARTPRSLIKISWKIRGLHVNSRKIQRS